MKSPKFKYIKPKLEFLFKYNNLQEIWKSRVKQQLRDQALSDLIEFRDYDVDIVSICRDIENSICDAMYSPGETKKFLVEKSKGLCRQMTLVRPMDLLVLETLSKVIYPALKRAAPTNKAYFEPNDGKFRAQVTESDYGSFASWKRFQRATLGFTDECRFVVVTDVANFYDFINFRHLRNIVAASGEVPEPFLDLLIFVLQKLSWSPDYMPSQEIGMPQIEASAPRVLANAMLYEVDRLVEEASIANYARFMDDIDFGTNTISQAKKIIRDIDLTLQSRQLRLNSSKTKILKAIEAHDHFCVSENRILEKFENLHQLVKNDSQKKSKLSKRLKEKHEKWWEKQSDGSPGENSRYLRGNGEKILKWSWRLLRKYGEQLSDEELLWAVRLNPGLRPVALDHLTHSKKSNSTNSKLLTYYMDGRFVDDLSIMNYSNYLINSNFRRTTKHISDIKSGVAQIEKSSPIGVACAIQVLAKYGNTSEIIEIGSRNFSLIRRDYYAARAIAACFPRFLGSSDFGEYIKLVRGLDSEPANSVLNFHLSLHNDVKFAIKQYAFLKAPNPTFAAKISLPKALMLLTAKNNSGFSSYFAQARAFHKLIGKDPYYAAMGL